MKKLIALVLTVAMLVTCFAFSASAADTAVELALEGPAAAAKDDTITVKLRLNDTNRNVGGVQGTIDATGAEVVSVTVNPDLKAYNDTTDVTTIYKTTDNDITFAAVNELKGERYDTRIWFIIQYKVTSEDGASFALTGVKVADTTATKIADTDVTLTNLTVATPETGAYLLGAGMLAEDETNTEPVNQGYVIKGRVNVDEITELGVIYYPTQLLGSDALTLETDGAVIASTNDATTIANIKNNFGATLNVGYTDNEKAAKFLGIKVSAVVYYKDATGTHYSENTVDKYIQGGVASKAILNAALDYIDTNEIVNDDLTAARAKINDTSDMYTPRKTVLTNAVNHALNIQ